MKKGKKKKLPLIIVSVAVLVILGVYIGVAVHFQNKFLPNTTVNNADASNRSWKEVEDELVSVMNEYKLTINGRNNIKDEINSADINMSMNFGDLVKEAQENQNEWLWPISFFKDSNIELKSVVEYDESLFSKKIDSMNCMDKKQAKAPENAYISDYDEKTGYSIIDEKENNQLDKDKFVKLVSENLNEMNTEISEEALEKEDVYNHPSIYKDDAKLVALKDNMNKLVNSEYTYKFGSDTVKVTGKEISQWLTTDKEKATVDVDSEKVREFVNSMSRKYDTFGKSREFKTTYGSTVTISNGDYGWWMNRPETTEKLIKAIKKGESTELEPVYFQKAVSYGSNDYGDTYVEINLTAQHLYLYKNGKMIMDTDFVSGSPSLNLTPTGVYPITYKERAHTMTGSDYRVETSYWMPFAGNVGMHDAMWRSKFGASLYKTNGSHGCVNLPYIATRTIYNNVEKGTPVICYKLPGTESSHVTIHSDSEIATIGIEAIERISTESPSEYTRQKKIRWARRVYNDLSINQRRYVTNYQDLLNAEKTLN